MAKTGPAIIGKLGDDVGSKRVGLDISQNREQVRVILNQGTLEPSLPNVARAAMAFVVMPSVGHGKRLKNAADRFSGLWSHEKLEMIGHQAIAKKSERIALLCLG